MALMVGGGLVVIGVAQLVGQRWLPTFRGPGRAGNGESMLGLVGFGVSYAVASLSCTLPIFLSLVVGPVASQSLLQSVAVFVAYGAGMSLVILVVTVGVASGRQRLITSIRGMARHLDRISGLIMLLAGGFIVWYWATVLSAGSVALAENGLVRWFERVSGSLAGLVTDRPLPVGAAGVAIVAAAIYGSRSARRGRWAAPSREVHPVGSEGQGETAAMSDRQE